MRVSPVCESRDSQAHGNGSRITYNDPVPGNLKESNAGRVSPRSVKRNLDRLTAPAYVEAALMRVAVKACRKHTCPAAIDKESTTAGHGWHSVAKRQLQPAITINDAPLASRTPALESPPSAP
jgi:hypothetical protein